MRLLVTAAVIASAAAIAGCGGQDSDFKLAGRWAWSDDAACAGDRNTLTITEGGVIVRLNGRVILLSDGAEWTARRRGDGTVVLLRYRWQGRSFEDSYRVLDEDRLSLRGSLIDGRPNRNVDALEAPVLVRCS